MSERIAKRLLIVGWDAADWKIVDALFSVGAMGNLKRLVENGVRANLASLEPRLSPLLWTSIATGKTADRHGVLNFVEPDPAGTGMRIVSSTTRKTKALWNILTQSSMKVNVVGWYASHPAEPINGVCVSNLFLEGLPETPDGPWPILKGAVHPPSLAEDIAQLRMHPRSLTASQLLPLVPGLNQVAPDDGRLQTLASEMARCLSVHNVATAILEDDSSWDCTMVFYDTIDTVGHNFMQYHPPRLQHISERDFEIYQNVMFSLYQFHDLMLGRLLELAGEETTVLLLSDHGFYSDHRRPIVQDMTIEQRAMVEASWHRPLGVLALGGNGIQKNQRIYGATLLDIAPTALCLLGLPVGADMQGRVLAESFERQAHPESTFSWDMVAGEAGMHPPDLRQDPYEAQDAIKQLVALGYMAEIPEQAKAKHDLAWRETQANLGAVYTNSGQPEKAVSIFEELVRKYPDDRRFAFALLRALYIAGRIDQCEPLLRQQIEKNPDEIDARIMHAIVLAALDRDQEAQAAADEVERRHDGRIDREAALGDMCAALGRWADAQRHFFLSVKHDPEAAVVHHGLARAAIGDERFEDAVDHCLRTLELVHVFPDAHHTLGVALTWLKDYDRAIHSFEIAISMRPSLLDSHRYLASIHRQIGNAEKARHHRQLAEQIIAERKSGQMSPEFLKRSVPLGPLEWEQRIKAGNGK